MLRFPYIPTVQAPGKPRGILAWIRRNLLRQPDPVRVARRVMRPLVPIRVRGPVQSIQTLGLLDTGSTDTVIPMELGIEIGANIAANEGAIKWRGQTYSRRTAEIEVEFQRGGFSCRWTVRAVFSSAPIGYLLLGDRGCLQYMDGKFLGEERFVELETNNSFPGRRTGG
jgi:hypothetical protein